MTYPKTIIVLAVGALCLSASAHAAAATAKSCGNSRPHGITSVMATNVSCATAVKVARNYNVSKVNPGNMNGWACRGTRISSTREKVTCKKGTRRVTFRSTYQVELPAAAAPPIVNGG